MNPFLNPLSVFPLVKNYVFDTQRLRAQPPEKIDKYRDKVLRRTLRYANSVPLYHDTYQAAGLPIQHVISINDITTLPYISKHALVEHFPNDLLPRGYNKKNTQVVSTSGSTGRPVSVFTDFSVFSGGIGASLRIFDTLGLSWRTARFADIGNLNPQMVDEVLEKYVYNSTSFLNNKKNRLALNAFLPIQEILHQLDQFKPDLILSYPATFFQLAYYKRKGYGKHIAPKALLVSGSVLEPYTRRYIEEAFGCRMHNSYGSVETSAQAPIAIECSEGTWHVNYDLFHVEAIDEQMEPVENGMRGHIVVTRLFGKATPIVRYTGLDDWVVLSDDEECSCGLRTPVLKGGVEGRRSDSVVLPDGRMFPAASFASFSSVLQELKTRKIRQFQIIQKKLHEIDILIVIDEDLRTVGPSVDVLLEKIREEHQKKAGPYVQITIREVQEIPSQKDKPAPIVISHIRPDTGFMIIDE